MKNKKHFTEKSTKLCKVCKQHLKQNLVDKNPNADMCYKHYQKFIRLNPKYILMLLTAILFTSCATMQQPNYVYKMDTYKVTKTNKFSVTAVSKDNKEIKVRNFYLQVGDTLYNWNVIPVIKF